MMIMTCTACHMHVEKREGVWKYEHITHDWDWRCPAREGYKPHTTTNVYTLANAA